LFLNAAAVATALPWPTLVDALEHAFVAGDAHVPPRLHYPLEAVDGTAPVLLVMPAWSARLGVGTKRAERLGIDTAAACQDTAARWTQVTFSRTASRSSALPVWAAWALSGAHWTVRRASRSR
jgi:hypothetical protein